MNVALPAAVIFLLLVPGFLLQVEAAQRNASVLAAAVVDFGGECYVVRGIVVAYFMQQTGELDRLVLRYADRRPLDSDKKPGDATSSERFYPIDGDSFILRYSEAITLNFQYVKLTQQNSPPPAAASEAAPISA